MTKLKKPKPTKLIPQRLRHVEDAIWALLQLNRSFFQDADSLRERLDRLESRALSSAIGIPMQGSQQ